MLASAERELLLLCARQDLRGQLRDRAEELFRLPLNWKELSQTAWRHGIAPLLFKHVRSFASEFIPETAFNGLRQMYVGSAFRGHVHSAALQEVERCFARHHLEVIALKGAALSRSLYRDVALRPFADIDLLVPESQIDAAKAALGEIGYALAPELLSETLNRKYHFNLPLARRAPVPVHIELHWRLTDPFTTIHFNHDGLFARAKIDPRLGSRILAKEDDLVYLAAHLDSHGYFNRIVLSGNANLDMFCLHELSADRLIWFTDLHEIILGQIDWTVVIENARTANALDALATTLQLGRRLLGTPVPDDLLTHQPSTATSWPRRKLGDRIVRLTNDEAGGNATARHLGRHLLATRRGFELRAVRLIDLWQYIFWRSHGRRGGYLHHVAAACARCGKKLFELCYQHARLILGARA